MPVAFVVTYGSKIRSRSSAATPLPWSSTVIATASRRVGAHRDHDVAGVPRLLAGVDAVLDQVREHALEQQLVGAHGDRRRGGGSSVSRAAIAGSSLSSSITLGERDRRRLDLRQRAERAERVDQPAQALDLLLDDLAGVGRAAS